MKDFDKIFRLAVYNALGSISATVYDEVKKVGDTDTIFVLLGAQRSKREPVADHLWGRRCSIELIITQKTDAGVSKDDIDDLADEILEVLFPTYDSFGVSVPSGFLFMNEEFETSATTRLVLSADKSIIAKTLTISCVIIQQL